MLCAVIPTLNSEATLEPLLAQLSGHAERIVIADGGSTDHTFAIAAHYHARIAMGHKGRGYQLARGASWASFNQENGAADWLLFLHSDCVLPTGWEKSVAGHINKHPQSAGYFAFGANATGLRARFMEFWVSLRTFWLKWPYGDQGLLITREMYEALGGYPEQILFEDVAFIKALKSKYGRAKLKPLKGKIMTDVSAYYKDGIWKRGSRNLGLLRGYLKGESVESLAARYK